MTLTPEKIKKTKAFQDWMDKNHPNWVGCTDSACTNGTNLNKGYGYGSFGTSTEKAWKLYGDEFNKIYVNVQLSQGENSQTVKSDEQSEVELFTRQFYFNGKTMSQLYNQNDLDRLVQFVIRDSNDLGVSLAEAYILYVFKLFNNNVQKLSVPNKYSDSVRDLQLMEEIVGLENLLIEQSSKTHTNFVVKNGRVVNAPTTTNMSNVTLDTIVNSKGFVTIDGSVDGSLPEESPVVSDIKKEIKYPKETGNVMTNDFVEFLKTWQGQNQITPTGSIDYNTVIKLYPERKPKDFVNPETAVNSGERTTQQTTKIPVKNESETKIKKSLEKSILSANRIISPTRGEDVNFEFCKDLFNTYPKEVKMLKKDLGITVNVSGDDLSKIVNPIKSTIETAYKRCKSQKSTKTALNRTGDYINIFKQGSASFDNLDEPFRIDV